MASACLSSISLSNGSLAAAIRSEAVLGRRAAAGSSISMLAEARPFCPAPLSVSRSLGVHLCMVRKMTTADIDAFLDAAERERENGEEGESSGGLPAGFQPYGSKLYVGNLPWTCNSEELARLFEEAGDVEVVEVIYDRETGRSRGFGFVTMGSVDDANSAIEKFDGREFMGRRLRVSFPDSSRSEGPRPRIEDSPNKLFVGNLPWGLDDISLENLFSEYGKVVESKVVYDRESGRSRGFGFVTLSSTDEVNEAISKMDGAEVQGRPLRVNLASDRPPPRQNF